MKKLIFIGGTSGVGKTIVTTKLSNQISHSAYLDGDWVWKINPPNPSAENRKMTIQNSQFLLNAYLSEESVEVILFCWDLDEQETIDELLQGLDSPFNFLNVSLVTSREKLTENINRDIRKGIRREGDLERAIEHLNKYQKVDSVKIDHQQVDETVQEIKTLIATYEYPKS